MKTEIRGVHLEISERAREYIDKKLARLAFAEGLVTDLLLTLARDKNRYQVEATVNFRWASSTHVRVAGFKLYEGIDALFDKLEPKIEKEKNKIQDHRKGSGERL